MTTKGRRGAATVLLLVLASVPILLGTGAGTAWAQGETTSTTEATTTTTTTAPPTTDHHLAAVDHHVDDAAGDDHHARVDHHDDASDDHHHEGDGVVLVDSVGLDHPGHRPRARRHPRGRADRPVQAPGS